MNHGTCKETLVLFQTLSRSIPVCQRSLELCLKLHLVAYSVRMKRDDCDETLLFADDTFVKAYFVQKLTSIRLTGSSCS